jgi:hypothetical protein
MIINQEPFPPGVKTIQELAQYQVRDVQQHATITTSLQPYTISGRSGYLYAFEGVGSFTVIVLPATNSATEGLTITYSAPDQRRYQAVVDRIIDSIQFSLL